MGVGVCKNYESSIEIVLMAGRETSAGESGEEAVAGFFG